MHSKKLSIIMLSASLDQNGGIATLEKLILKYTPSNIQIQPLTSHHEGFAYQLAFLRKAWSLPIGRLLAQKVDLVHFLIFDRCSLAEPNYLMKFPIALMLKE